MKLDVFSTIRKYCQENLIAQKKMFDFVCARLYFAVYFYAFRFETYLCWKTLSGFEMGLDHNRSCNIIYVRYVIEIFLKLA